jgi:hypothetical protein
VIPDVTTVSLECETCGREQLAEIERDYGASYRGQQEEFTSLVWLDSACKCERTDLDKELALWIVSIDGWSESPRARDARSRKHPE